MGKSIFPLRPEPEDDKFVDPDARFNSLPYSSEIPEAFTDAFRTPPFNLQFFKYCSCREKIATVGSYGFVFGWMAIGNQLVQARYGRAVTRWRIIWYNVAGGIIGSLTCMLGVFMQDLTCSPYATGRRRNMFYEESIRHALNSRYGLYENLDRIMMAKERITRLEFYEAFQTTIENPYNLKEF